MSSKEIRPFLRTTFNFIIITPVTERRSLYWNGSKVSYSSVNVTDRNIALAEIHKLMCPRLR